MGEGYVRPKNIKEVKAYEYDGQLFSSKEAIEEYQKGCLKRDIQKVIYWDDYNECSCIALKDLRILYNTYSSIGLGEELMDQLEELSNGE